ncbi:hypothetical protein B0H14DRAFT_2580735 [Mycena olivaceomarginata]|nr:hypothetical protein B0H14DRAFT_2580735 [Mycena olivaceomarginata]
MSPLLRDSLTGSLRIRRMESGVAKIPRPVRGTSACVQVYPTHHVSLVFGVSFTMSTLAGYPGWRCSFTSFLSNFIRQQLSIMFSGCLFLCIALNVPLVVVQNVNGQAMEKYYVAGTVLICLICNTPLYASGNLGHVLIPVETCWFNNPEKEACFRWIIGTQISWLFIFAVGEASAFLIILGYLVRHEVSQPKKQKGVEREKKCVHRPVSPRLSFIRALNALWHPEAESPTQSDGRSYCLSTIVDILPDDTYSYDSETLHNDRAQQEQMHVAQESSTVSERDLGMRKEWRSYFRHEMSVAATRLSISRPAPTLPTIDVDLVRHI